MTIFELFHEMWLVVKTFYLAFSAIKENRNKKVKLVLDSNMTMTEKLTQVNLLFKEEKENRKIAAKKLQDFFKERYK